MKLAGLWKKDIPITTGDLPHVTPTREVEESAAYAETSDVDIDYSVASDTLATILLKQGKLEDARKIYIQIARAEPERYEEMSMKIRRIDEALKQVSE
jgi:hypothetical protein